MTDSLGVEVAEGDTEEQPDTLDDPVAAAEILKIDADAELEADMLCEAEDVGVSKGLTDCCACADGVTVALVELQADTKADADSKADEDSLTLANAEAESDPLEDELTDTPEVTVSDDIEVDEIDTRADLEEVIEGDGEPEPDGDGDSSDEYE